MNKAEFWISTAAPSGTEIQIGGEAQITVKYAQNEDVRPREAKDLEIWEGIVMRDRMILTLVSERELSF